MSQTFSEPDAETAGRWEDGRWVEQERPAVESDASDDLPVTADTGELEDDKRVGSSEEPGETVVEPIADETGDKELIPVVWERAAYAALFIGALIMRLWDLGARAIHHDESLHGFFAWQISTGSGYEHNPLMHGMFLFHSVAGSFFLFGDNDFTLRLPMALFGSGLVLMPLLLRSRLGQVGALAAAVMLTFSPAMLYFSRFARNDIFMAVFVLGLFAMIWRYMDERKNRYLYLAAAFLALGFTSKETMYLSALILVVGLLFLARWQVGNWLWGRTSFNDFDPAGRMLILLSALTLPLAGALVAFLQEPLGITLAAKAGNTAGVHVGAPDGGGWVIAVAVTVVLVVVAMAVGLFWNRRVWLISWVIFAAIFLTMFTNFFTHPGGVGSGIWQSLGYWLAQHEVARAEQPMFYYFMILFVYEFLPWLIALGAAGYYSYKGDRFTRFLVFWAAATLIAYTMAGEKMPWLLVNITLPLIILAGRAINDLAKAIPWRTVTRTKLPYLLIGVPLFVILIWRLAFFEFDNGVLSFFTLWALFGAVGVLVVSLTWLARQVTWKTALSASALVMCGILFLLTVRAGWVATYVHSDVPREMLIYTQTAPDLHNLVREIETAGNLTGDRKEIRLSIDSADGFTWPWAWYLRGYDNVTYPDQSESVSPPGDGTAIAVINAKNNTKVEPELGEDYTDGRRIVHRWWFPENETYKNPSLSLRKFGEAVVDRDAWRTSLDFFLYRKLASDIGSVDSFVYFDRDIPLAAID